MALKIEFWAFIFGIIGNTMTVAVFLSPLPTFYVIYQKKSTAGFQVIPYAVALFSAMLWVYYSLVKTESVLLFSIQSFGVVVELGYIIMFLVFAPIPSRVFAIRLVVLLNVIGYGVMLLLTMCLLKGAERLNVVGWFCLIFNVGVFCAPLFVIRRVIRERSVACMPFFLSLSLTVNAIVWFIYGLLVGDYYIGLPNTFGFVFGVIQMGVYLKYRNATPIIAAGQDMNGGGGARV